MFFCGVFLLCFYPVGTGYLKLHSQFNMNVITPRAGFKMPQFHVPLSECRLLTYYFFHSFTLYPPGDLLSLNLPAPHCPWASSWLYCPTSTQSQILANALCMLNSLLPDLHTHCAYTQSDLSPTVGFLSSHATQCCRSPLRNECTQRTITKSSCAWWLASFLCLAILTFILVNTQMSPPQQPLRTPGLQFHLGHTPSQHMTWSEQTEVS